MDFILHFQTVFIVALLIMLEIALSVDNLAGMRKRLVRLPKSKRAITSTTASVSGLLVRVSLVLLLVNLGKLMDPMFADTIFKSGRGVLLALGGAFLLVKAMSDLKHHRNREDTAGLGRLDNQTPSLPEIIVYDALLSIDSVVAALALANNLHLVLIAMVLAHILLNVFWKQIDDFFLERPSMMTITLAFVLVVGLVSMVRVLGVVLAEETLVAALLFAIMVEFMNGRRTPKTVLANTSRERVRSYARLQAPFNEVVSDADAIAYQHNRRFEDKQSVSFKRSADATPVENLFTALTCDHCSSTTYSAFQFCMSCGHSQQPA